MRLNSFFFIIISLSGFYINAQEQRNFAIVLDLNYQDIISKSSSAYKLNNLINSNCSLILTNKHVFEIFYTQTNPRFDSDNKWNIYEQSGFILLIPKEYEKNNSLNVCLNLKNFNQYQKKQLILSLSLKTKFYVFNILDPILLKLSSKKFIKILKELFIHKDINKNIKWNIFLSGHGFETIQTCGLEEKYFIDLLDFLENHINTNTFFYSSCNANGQIQEYIYGKRKFSFPIFSQGLASCNTHSFSTFNYKELFINLSKIKNFDISKHKKLILDHFDQIKKISKNEFVNLVQIRLPGKDYFEILQVPDKILLASQLKENQKEIKADYLILDVNHINKDLVLNKNTKIASNLKGESYHYFKKTHSNYNLISTGLNLEDYGCSKIFLIEEMIVQKSKAENIIVLCNSVIENKQVINIIKEMKIPQDIKYIAFYKSEDKYYLLYQKRCEMEKLHEKAYLIENNIVIEYFLNKFQDIKKQIFSNHQAHYTNKTDNYNYRYLKHYSNHIKLLTKLLTYSAILASELILIKKYL